VRCSASPGVRDPAAPRLAAARPAGTDLDRPRERLLARGGDRLSTEELVTLVLGAGTPGRPAAVVARELLRHAGGLPALSRASPRELAAVRGVGEARAARVAAAFHLGRRAVERAATAAAQVRGPADVHQRLRPRMSGLVQEIFVVLALDIRNVVIDEIEVARGCLTGVDVHPREVFRPLIRQAAAAAVVAHNHPSGDPTPSDPDIALTRRLREVGELVGIPVLDHVVVGRDGFVSIAELVG
jgi:DNA repair protein RadC